MLLKDVHINKNTISKLNPLFENVDVKREYFIKEYIRNKCNGENVLYVHTPFCLQKCKYCTCESTASYSTEDFENFYCNTISEHIYLYKEIFNNVEFQQIYFGGGTPTIADHFKLQQIFERIPHFSSIPLKCIEASPHTITKEQLYLFKQYGFAYISVGIQSLDKSICKKHNRLYISKDEFKSISIELKNSGIYFNYDLICYLNKGDVRDLPQFENDLNFVMEYGKPSSITIHQYYQSIFTFEKTKALIDVIKKALKNHNEYCCINSMLDDEDVFDDTKYQAEYRLVSTNYYLSHYMWNKYASIPVKGYNILSIGYYYNQQTVSNTGRLCYISNKNDISFIKYDNFIYDDYYCIRKLKGLSTNLNQL